MLSVLTPFFFFFHDTATTEIYTYCHTLSLHDALPISSIRAVMAGSGGNRGQAQYHARATRGGTGNRDAAAVQAGDRLGDRQPQATAGADRKSTRLNSSH